MTLLETSADIERYYVTVSWVARHYDVPKLKVYRAIAARKLTAARVAGDRRVYVLDRRLLPLDFPT